MVRKPLLAALLATAAVIAALSAGAQERHGASASQARVEQQLQRIHDELVALQADVSRIRKRVDELANRRWEYTVTSQNRLKSRDTARLFNEMSTKGWELFMMMPSGEFVFRKPMESR